MSGYKHPNLLALDEVESILEAYADARLAPRKPVLARMRAAVVAEAASAAAARAAAQRQAAAAAALEAASPRRRLRLPRLRLANLARPAFALGFAGLLAIATGTAITAASPGSPLYMARVALEDLFLPVQIDARFASHEQHLDERLAEAEAAASSGDPVALEAALVAYQQEIDQTLADIGNDYGRLARFQAVLERHLAKLTALSLQLPTDVASGNAGAHAIQASKSAATKAADAVSKVTERKAQANDRPLPTPGADPPARSTVSPVQPDNPDRRIAP
ncbi:MAG TPA: DUF5667 domain-containing protein [Candidatus Limnocylindrales bacterium]|nr:DUF5667 domain-containing protein [Candidatus Limnocylindrales bacterium]